MRKIAIVGEAGSGKSTVAEHIVYKHNGASLSLSTPIKIFVEEVFEFTEDQLYGPSCFRDEIDRRFSSKLLFFKFVLKKYHSNNRKAVSERFCELYDSWYNTLPLDKLNAIEHRVKLLEIFLRIINKRHICPRDVLQLFGTEFGRYFDEDVWVNMLLPKIESLNTDIVVVTDCRFINEVKSLKERGFEIWAMYGKFSTKVNKHVSESSVHDPEIKKLVDCHICNTVSLAFLYEQIDRILAH